LVFSANGAKVNVEMTMKWSVWRAGIAGSHGPPRIWDGTNSKLLRKVSNSIPRNANFRYIWLGRIGR
jgi:hypothetical protein